MPCMNALLLTEILPLSTGAMTTDNTLSADVMVTAGPTFFAVRFSGTPTANPPFLETSRLVATSGVGLGVGGRRARGRIGLGRGFRSLHRVIPVVGRAEQADHRDLDGNHHAKVHEFSQRTEIRAGAYTPALIAMSHSWHQPCSRMLRGRRP